MILGVGVFLSSCSQATIQVAPTALATGLLTPYKTVTSSPSIPTATVRVTIPVTPSPTATPYIYIVKGNETMISIAYQFGISWEALQAANPEVNPRAMGEGLKLIIPINVESPEIISTSTPMPVQMEQPICYPTGDGGVWCVAVLKNGLETSLENLSVWIGLYDSKGEIIIGQEAFSALNILRPGSSMPMMAYFAPPLPEKYQVKSEVLSGLAVAVDDTRYIDLQAEIGKLEISKDGSLAVVSGDVVAAEDTPSFSQLWILAVAYDAKGNIIGARKWKSGGETQFEITVFSLGGKIDHVEALVEARP
jgi:LysM repeat protein